MHTGTRHRSFRITAVLVVLADGSDLRAQPQTSSQRAFAGVTVHAPDAFYDPPTQVPNQPGALLRSEPLKDVTLPPGMRGWRIYDHRGRQDACHRRGNRVRTGRSAPWPAPCGHLGARHDGLAAEVHAVACVGADARHSSARQNPGSGLGQRCERLFLHRAGRPASLSDWRSRGARGSIRCAPRGR